MKVWVRERSQLTTSPLVKKGFDSVDRRFDGVDDRLDRIEKLVHVEASM
jgi:hypothetical protein